MSYALEKFFDAAFCLASEEHKLKQRLVAAAEYLTRLKAEDFSDDGLRSRFLDLVQRLAWKEPFGEEGTLWISVDAMSEDEAMETAREIGWMYMALADRETDSPLRDESLIAKLKDKLQFH